MGAELAIWPRPELAISRRHAAWPPESAACLAIGQRVTTLPPRLTAATCAATCAARLAARLASPPALLAAPCHLSVGAAVAAHLAAHLAAAHDLSAARCRLAQGGVRGVIKGK